MTLKMKSNVLLSFMASLIALSMAVSCEDLSEDQGKEDDKEIVEPGGEVETEYSTPDVIEVEGEEFPVPHPRLPFDVYDGHKGPVVLDSDAVSVEVTEVTANSVKFVCRPGENVASYVIDVWPLSSLYNTLLDNGGLDKNNRELEAKILDMLFTTGSGGYAIDDSILGEDYTSYEYDWANSQYAQFSFLPDAQYVIGIAACYEKSSSLSNVTALTLVYVETDNVESAVEPDLSIRVKTGFTAYVAEIIPGENCKGFYYIDTQADMLDEYVDVFGDRALRDLMRHWWSPNTPRPVDTEEARSVRHEFSNPDPSMTHTIVAVAVDASGKPAENYTRQDFNLKEVGEDAGDAEISVAVDYDLLGASYVEYDMTLAANCRTAYFYIITKHQADSLTTAGAEAMAAMALDLKAGGNGVNNELFQYSDEFGLAESQEYTSRDVSFILQPDTEYVVAYCGLNYGFQLSPLGFSEPFKTLPRVFDRPQDCKADLKLEFTDVDIASVKFNFTYNPDYLASFRFMCIEYSYDDGSGLIYSVPEDDAPREDWIDLFYVRAESPKTDEYYASNLWWRNPSGRDSYTLADLPIGKTTRYAYIAEDIYGVISDVMFAEFTTLTPQGGPNPTMEIVPEYNKETGLWTVTYNSISDVVKFSYALVDQSDDLLGNSASILQAEGYPVDYYNAWKSGMTIGNRGLTCNYRSVTQQTEDPEMLYLALSIAYGVDENGQECKSKLYYWLLAPGGEAKLLSDIWPQWKEKDSL